MIAGKVVGSLVSTRKSEKLIGNKFMIVEPLRHMQADTRQIIAIDNIGAGIGEYVIVAQGSAARIGCDMEDAPVDAAIVGIIDEGGILEQRITENSTREWCGWRRRRRIPDLCKNRRTCQYHSSELRRVRASAEAAQAADGEARL